MHFLTHSMRQLAGRRALVSAAGAMATRMLVEEGASSLSPGTRTAYILTCVALVIVSGLSAGLTLGLLSLDRIDIHLMKRTGTPRQQWLVKRVEPLVADPHYLMVSLLLCNAAAYEALPIFLDRLLNPLAAILISVTAILIFGEIVPQAVCKRYGLQVGAYLSWLVRLVMFVTAPISWPVGKLLDWVLGEETALFRRPELRALVTLHAEAEEEGGESMLTAEEVKVIHGAMDMAHKTAQTAMTPLHKVTGVPAEAVLDRALIASILASGHSRVPVYEGGDMRAIIGLLLVKELVLVDLSEGKRVRECRMRSIDYIRADTPLYSVMEFFRLKRRHMAVITAVTHLEPSSPVAAPQQLKPAVPPPGGTAIEMTAACAGASCGGPTTSSEAGTQPLDNGAQHAKHDPDHASVIGVITIEDVIEELLQHEMSPDEHLHGDATTTAGAGLPAALSKYVSKARRPRSSVAGGRVSVTWHGATAVQDAMVAAAAGAAFAAAMQANTAVVAASSGESESEAVAMGAARRAKSASVLSVAPLHFGDTLLPPGHDDSDRGVQDSASV